MDDVSEGGSGRTDAFRNTALTRAARPQRRHDSLGCSAKHGDATRVRFEFHRLQLRFAGPVHP
jgi:hypothetical protein